MLAVCGVLFLGLLILGVPIFMSMIIPCLAALRMNFPGMDMGLTIQRMVGGIDTFSLLSIPFFMYAADIMSKGDIGHKLVNFANKLVGHLPGGLQLPRLSHVRFLALSQAQDRQPLWQSV